MLLKYREENVWFKKVLHFYFQFKSVHSKVKIRKKNIRKKLLCLFLEVTYKNSRYGSHALQEKKSSMYFTA